MIIQCHYGSQVTHAFLGMLPLYFIATMLYVASLHKYAIVASGMYHIVFIKTKNIVVNEIGRIICTHLLAHAHTYFYITLLCMHDAATYNIVAINLLSH